MRCPGVSQATQAVVVILLFPRVDPVYECSPPLVG
jgi:hypothetical protein